jgi:hypothetical protein
VTKNWATKQLFADERESLTFQEPMLMLSRIQRNPKESAMKKALILATVLSFSASTAFAGGPVVVPDEGEPDVITTGKSGSGKLLPLILGIAVIAAVAGSGS